MERIPNAPQKSICCSFFFFVVIKLNSDCNFLLILKFAEHSDFNSENSFSRNSCECIVTNMRNDNKYSYWQIREILFS